LREGHSVATSAAAVEPPENKSLLTREVLGWLANVSRGRRPSLGEAWMVRCARQGNPAIIEVVAIAKRAGSGVAANVSLMFGPLVQPDLKVEVICQQMGEGRKPRECPGPGKGKIDETATGPCELRIQNMEINSVNGDHEESCRIFYDGQEARLGRFGDKDINL
jgi:hypothetical protein